MSADIALLSAASCWNATALLAMRASAAAFAAASRKALALDAKLAKEELRLLDAPADFYVPHRLEEGYGLNCEALRQIAERGTSVVITVDCGIGSRDEAVEARRLGLELIITGHHEFPPTLPDAAGLVHPRLPGTDYPFGGLSGSGVAFKVAWALCQRACGGEKVTLWTPVFTPDGKRCVVSALENLPTGGQRVELEVRAWPSGEVMP